MGVPSLDITRGNRLLPSPLEEFTGRCLVPSTRQCLKDLPIQYPRRGHRSRVENPAPTLGHAIFDRLSPKPGSPGR